MNNEKLVEDHVGMVPKLVNTVARNLPAHVDKAELISAGNMGLVMAANSYEAGHNTEFSTWANSRIMGAIKDELRRLDPGTRNMRRRQRLLDETDVKLSSTLGRPATRHEIAKEAGLTREEMDSHQLAFDMAIIPSLQWISQTVDDEGCTVMDKIADPSPTAETTMLLSERLGVLKEELTHLNDREKLIIQMYYFDELNLREIGAHLEITESRVSQLHSRAIKKLKAAAPDLLTV